MTAPKTEKALKSDVAHILATAATAFGVSLATLGTNFTKAAIITAAVAAVHTALAKFFPSNT
jgi:hypothetical protein